MTDTADTPQAPQWDLSPLYAGLDDPQFDADLAWLKDHYPAFSAAFQGRLQTRLGEALEAWERIQERLNRLFIYLHLRHAANLEDEAVKSRLYEANILTDGLGGEHATFFPIELAALSEEDCASQIAADPRCARLKPWIDKIRQQRPFMLSTEVEAALTKRATFGSDSWSAYYDEVESDLRFSLAEGPRTLEETLHRLAEEPDPDQRFAILTALNGGLGGSFARFSAQTLNMVIGGKGVEDRERGYAHAMDFRNRNNRLPDAMVTALHQAVEEEASPLGQRYYRLKARLMGLPQLRWSDRNALLPFADRTHIPFDEALEMVQGAFASFSPTLARLAEGVATGRAIDAHARPAKQSGAFNYSVVLPGGCSASYVLMNYQGSSRDVMTLAHELGHAVHGLLAGPAQGPLLASAPMAYAETASIFAEMTTFRFLRERLRQNGNPQALLALLMGRIEDFLNTVVRQIGFSCFEQQMHATNGRLSAPDLSRLWLENLIRFYGPEGEPFTYAETNHLWSYISHFHNPFYVYAYACGELLTQSLYAVQGNLGERFESHYLDLLRAGGSRDVTALLSPFGLDPTRSDFWKQGIRVSLGAMLAEAEALAESLQRSA
ncbi:MAG: oligoendopeptidase F [Magnetococcales bacterium]|nr:oligoendopeptidase F [Magnetococcales bacterium]